MTNYQEIIHKLGYPRAVRLCDARIAALFATFKSPPDWYGFPPALIPIMSDGTWPVYVGLWKHWFVPKAPSFVELNVGNNYRLAEIARTDRHLALLMIIRLIVQKDDVDDDVLWLSTHLDVSADDLSRLDRFTQEYGDDPKRILLIPEFAAIPPADFPEADDYSDDFLIASGHQIGGSEAPRDVSLAEVEEQPWLNPHSDKQKLFDHYMQDRNFSKAWLALNSSGWEFPTAAKALEKLMDNSDDPSFHQLCDGWIALASNYSGQY